MSTEDFYVQDHYAGLDTVEQKIEFGFGKVRRWIVGLLKEQLRPTHSRLDVLAKQRWLASNFNKAVAGRFEGRIGAIDLDDPE